MAQSDHAVNEIVGTEAFVLAAAQFWFETEKREWICHQYSAAGYRR